MDATISQIFGTILGGGNPALIALLLLYILTCSVIIYLLIKERTRLLKLLHERYSKHEELYEHMIEKYHDSTNEMVKSLTEVRIVLVGLKK